MIPRIIYAQESVWIESAAACCMAAVDSAWQRGQRPVLCLAGGATPLPVYRLLSEKLLAAAPRYNDMRPLLVVGDERIAPSDRNETAIRAAFNHADVEIVGWDIEAGVEGARRGMEAFLAECARGRAPLFDAVFLGLGADGHTAGIFTIEQARSETCTVCSEAQREPKARISLSCRALADSKLTRYLVRAAGKESALAALAAGDRACPAVYAAAADASILCLYA